MSWFDSNTLKNKNKKMKIKIRNKNSRFVQSTEAASILKIRQKIPKVSKDNIPTKIQCKESKSQGESDLLRFCCALLRA